MGKPGWACTKNSNAFGHLRILYPFAKYQRDHHFKSIFILAGEQKLSIFASEFAKQRKEDEKPTWSYWSVAAMGLLWSVMGCLNFKDDCVAQMPQSYHNLIAQRPFWATAAFAFAVFGGAVGCILLLLRRAVARAFVGEVNRDVWLNGLRFGRSQIRSRNDWPLDKKRAAKGKAAQSWLRIG
ncbi:hypothetical protein [Yoonia sp. BS5-3]|uniref:Uncharacterized protein n=1 Tax=Yoonia phaeophyticola TaxID=3137369 RepID=A0ABZ2V7K1_9RHOB